MAIREHEEVACELGDSTFEGETRNHCLGGKPAHYYPPGSLKRGGVLKYCFYDIFMKIIAATFKGEDLQEIKVECFRF